VPMTKRGRLPNARGQHGNRQDDANRQRFHVHIIARSGEDNTTQVLAFCRYLVHLPVQFVQKRIGRTWRNSSRGSPRSSVS
jgi:hypothetical protein